MTDSPSQNTASASGDTLDFKRILPIFIIVLVDLMGLTIIIPLLPLYAASFGANAITIGALGAAYPLMQLVGAPLLGGVSDRFGRKPVLVVSQIGTLIGFLILGFADVLWMIFLSRIIDGFTGGNIVVAQAAITDSTTEKTRTQGLGLIGAAFGLGFTLGPAIGGIALVVSGNNYQVPAFVAAAFSLVSILLTIFWFHETLPESERGKSDDDDKPQENIIRRTFTALRNPLIGALLVLMFMQQLVFGGFEQLLALFTLSRLGMNAAANAGLFVFVGIILVLVQGKFIGPWSRKYGERRLIYGGLALLTVGLIIVAFTPEHPVPWYSRAEIEAEFEQSGNVETVGGQEISVPLPDDSNTGVVGILWLLAAMIPTSVGGGILSPSINSLITKRVKASTVGSSLGISSSLRSAANAITPLIGGIVFQVLGSTAPFLIGGIIMGALLVMSLRHIQAGPEEDRVKTQASSPSAA